MVLFLSLTLFTAGMSEMASDDCHDCCQGECLPGCGCVSCPPVLTMIESNVTSITALPALHSWTSLEAFSECRQEWYSSVFHPPQNLL